MVKRRSGRGIGKASQRNLLDSMMRLKNLALPLLSLSRLMTLNSILSLGKALEIFLPDLLLN
jgi:hypothetical protein